MRRKGSAQRVGRRFTLTLAAAVASGGAAAPALAQDAAVAGAWDVTMAISVERDGDTGEVRVRERTPADLTLIADGERVVGELSTGWEGVEDVTVHLEGTFRDGELDLDPVETVRADGSVVEEFRGFYVNGTLGEDGLSGEMWSAVLRNGEERHRGPLPWSAAPKDGGTSSDR